jgi:hypothetical protein
MDRREFLTGSIGAAVLAARPADAFAQRGAPPQSHDWDAGQVRHLLPTVSDTSILIKASFSQPLVGTPSLRIGGKVVPGRMNDTRGEFMPLIWLLMFSQTFGTLFAEGLPAPAAYRCHTTTSRSCFPGSPS